MAIRMRSVLLFCVIASFSLLRTPTLADKKSYVVYLGPHSHGPDATLAEHEQATKDHYELLGSYLGCSENAQKAIFYSYRGCINGFAANLEEEEARKILKHPRVISVFPNKRKRLHTTRSWSFLGLERDGRVPSHSIWAKARFGEDTIIGSFDSGVWPESESFKDEGMGPVPSRWKGSCQSDTKEGVQCNRKLIGAKYFNKGYESAVGHPLNASFNSARDSDGHGTHTLSTAGGGFVPGANIFGYGNGTAKGGSPNARLAMYKVCWPPEGDKGGCLDADIMAAFDMAIQDGVDVLSVSLGGDAADYFEDPIAIGSFHAVMNGITVVSSAGNSGPLASSVTNTAPWILTVAASSMDREFLSYLKLGNNKKYKGGSLSADYLPEKMYPLISASEAKATNATAADAEHCLAGSLDADKVTGKIVICIRGNGSRFEKGLVVRQAGGVGMVLANDEASGNEMLQEAHSLPATHITYSQRMRVFSYINSTQSPVAYITRPKTAIGKTSAPVMGVFSSRGPNLITPQILKPDVTAPGISVLAAFTQTKGPAENHFDTRRVLFNVESGTSMSSPHVAGIVGLLKTLHPAWSPAAIRSAIMTTASCRNNDKSPIMDYSLVKATPFAYGAGQVRPNLAMDPGLIYDITVDDYLNFLCALGYNSSLISAFAAYQCPARNVSLLDLNYPSITVPALTSPTTITRTVKNVGGPGMYTARVVPPHGVSVSVEPNSLKFEKIGEEKTFTVTLAPTHHKISDHAFGKLTWSDGVHHVRSPLVVS